MGLSRGEAYESLELPFGADTDSIRTSYKRLAMKWHPDKHKNSPESIKNFLELSMSYKRLNIDSDIIQMSLSDCLQLYQQTFSPTKLAYINGFDESDDDDDDYDDDDDDDDDEYPFRFPSRFGGLNRYHEEDIQRNMLSAEQIEKNANELITEEEKEKRRAEKRRAKKKRRREKKRQEKAVEQKKDDDQKKKVTKKENGADPKLKKEKTGNESAESETEEFDQSAAFFTQVVNKKKKAAVPEPVNNIKAKSEQPIKTTNGNEDQLEDLDPVVLRSRQLAIEGNKMANVGHYQAAIDLFTEAVRLDPRDFRFFGNRSYCFDRMQQYEKALKDAEKAIQLAPDWPKGYFRKGRALAGLKLNADAEQSFMQVLKLDRLCEDAMSELLRVRTYQLTEMGFSQQQAQNAIRQYDSVQQALDSLLAGVVGETSLASEVYMSDEEDYPGLPTSTATTHPHTITSHHLPVTAATAPSHKANDVKMDPGNPEGLTALWVGNVLPEVTEKKLHTMFSKYGQVTSVRPLPEKYCAFVNFKTKEAAGAAMKYLQGVPCAGQQLLIKFPDNPIVNGNTANNVVIRKPTTTTKPPVTSFKPALNLQALTNNNYQQAPGGPKLSGPVNGNECYFWRTTGCTYGKDCHYKHVPDHKGLDKKPWQKH